MPTRSSTTPSNELSYRPSAYFFRKELRAAPTLKVAAALVSTLRAELCQLSAWMAGQGIAPPPSAYLQAPAPRKLVDMRELGLALCRELERHKATIREKGLIPPRFKATASEAEAKAWREATAPQTASFSPPPPLAG